MKNYEKYAEEIKEYEGSSFCGDFIIPHILKSQACRDTNCMACRMLQTIWLFEEYEEPKEPEVDWSKVKVDTPILVKHNEAEEWERRYFAKYVNGIVYAWGDGCTSWTVYDNTEVTDWDYAKLAESEEGGAE